MGKWRGQSVLVGDVIPCLGLLDGMVEKKIGEEVDGVDPLGLTVAGQEFFIEDDVTFDVDACCGFFWWPFDGAVDFFVLEAFVDKASVACGASGGVPAVYVSVKWVHGVRE